MTREEQAVETFAKGFNCAQSVLSAFSEDFGLDKILAFKMTNGLGGGVRCGEVCGALNGGAMVVGLNCGYFDEKDLEQKGFCNNKTYEFIERFKEENGSMLCREILGMDIRVPTDFTRPEVRERHDSVCPKIVASAVRILESMEFESGSQG